MNEKERLDQNIKAAIKSARLKVGLSIEELSKLSNFTAGYVHKIITEPGSVSSTDLFIVLQHLHIYEELQEILKNPLKLRKFMEE